MYADVAGARRQVERSGERGSCPTCGGVTIGKCGSIVIPHWAHEAIDDCDTWSEPISRWHLRWQERVPSQQREVSMRSHRADIVTDGGVVVEIQRSAISADEIREREQFYGRMVWIFDVREAWNNERLYVARREQNGNWWRWKHARKSIAASRRQVYLDFGSYSIAVGQKHLTSPPFRLYGWTIDNDEVLPRVDAATGLRREKVAP